METAQFIKKLDGWQGESRLYRLSKSVEYYCWQEKKRKTRKTSYVAVSAVIPRFAEPPETFIFPTTKTGKVLDWSELNGSFVGELNHKKALKQAGYREVITAYENPTKSK